MSWSEWLKRPLSLPVYVATAPFTEAEMERALSVPDTNPLLCAVLQLIEEEIVTANEAAQASVASHGICASEVGGAQHLDRLRIRLLATRGKVMEEK